MSQATTSLLRRGHDLARPAVQLRILNDDTETSVPSFTSQISSAGLHPLRPLTIATLQVNLGKQCNQACKHCHVDAGPDRTEMMSQEVMQHCLDAVDVSGITTVDITGGAPEMHPHFRWFVDELRRRNVTVMVRCNLTIIVANPKYADLPEYYAHHRVHVVSSLPHYDASLTDRQRGRGVYEDSITALKMLNAVGYGQNESELLLDLVYNPPGALLPGPQQALEQDFRRILRDRHGIEFTSLHCITNMPISRFLDYLRESGNYVDYMEKLVAAFNPAAAASVMCRSLVSVGWDGVLYDCDFNQMLELPVRSSSRTIAQFSHEQLLKRTIVVGNHCYGCTAGSGSSCGGQLVVDPSA
ncbi:MAG TPA: arsenosugar biosynthesis radical SAM protein ArsS [Chlorobiota bacterium]|nr:arsenosugar biosynthesis radical SAM protein ArsS [Chlorobiota bacterium]